MNLISKYVGLLILNEKEYSFDNKTAEDYIKSVTDIMESFKSEILREAKFTPSGGLYKLKRLSHENNV